MCYILDWGEGRIKTTERFFIWHAAYIKNSISNNTLLYLTPQRSV